MSLSSTSYPYFNIKQHTTHSYTKQFGNIDALYTRTINANGEYVIVNDIEHSPIPVNSNDGYNNHGGFDTNPSIGYHDVSASSGYDVSTSGGYDANPSWYHIGYSGIGNGYYGVIDDSVPVDTSEDGIITIPFDQEQKLIIPVNEINKSVVHNSNVVKNLNTTDKKIDSINVSKEVRSIMTDSKMDPPKGITKSAPRDTIKMDAPKSITKKDKVVQATNTSKTNQLKLSLSQNIEATNEEKKQIETREKAKQLELQGLYDRGDAICLECKANGYESEVVEDYKNGICVCSCGLVLVENKISDEIEWRNFENDGNSSKADPNRVGGPEDEFTLKHGLSSSIEGSDDLSMLQRKLSMDSDDGSSKRRLIEVKRYIDKISSLLSLTSKTITRSLEIFGRIEDTKEFKKGSLGGIAVSCLIIACREAHVPRTIAEFCSVADVKKREINRVFTKIKINKLYKSLTNTGGNSSYDYETQVGRFCYLLGLSAAKISNRIVSVLQKCDELAIFGGTTPATKIGATIYFMEERALKLNSRGLKHVSDVVCISESALRRVIDILIANSDTLMKYIRDLDLVCNSTFSVDGKDMMSDRKNNRDSKEESKVKINI